MYLCLWTASSTYHKHTFKSHRWLNRQQIFHTTPPCEWHKCMLTLFYMSCAPYKVYMGAQACDKGNLPEARPPAGRGRTCTSCFFTGHHTRWCWNVQIARWKAGSYSRGTATPLKRRLLQTCRTARSAVVSRSHKSFAKGWLAVTGYSHTAEAYAPAQLWFRKCKRSDSQLPIDAIENSCW